MATECFFSFDIFEIHSDNFLGGGYADGSGKYKVFDFVLYVSELFLFFVFVLDPNFCGTNFFTFQDTVWLVEKF